MIITLQLAYYCMANIVYFITINIAKSADLACLYHTSFTYEHRIIGWLKHTFLVVWSVFKFTHWCNIKILKWLQTAQLVCPIRNPWAIKLSVYKWFSAIHYRRLTIVFLLFWTTLDTTLNSLLENILKQPTLQYIMSLRFFKKRQLDPSPTCVFTFQSENFIFLKYHLMKEPSLTAQLRFLKLWP